MKHKKLGISLKYKLLLLLTIIPVVSLIIYIFMATRLFENDKIAYVKDSSVTVAKTLALQIRTEVKAFAEQIKPIIENYDRTNLRFSETSLAIFNKLERLDGIVLLQRSTNGALVRLGALHKNNEFAKLFVNEQNINRILIERPVEAEIMISSLPFSENHLLISTKMGGEIEPGSTSPKIPPLIILGFYRAKDLYDAFNKPSIYQHFLIDRSGLVRLGPSQGRLDPQVIREILKNTLPEGASDVQSNRSLIVSYADAGVADFRVTAIVDRAEALSAVNVLFMQSFLFFIALISTTIIISVFASVRLTAALRELYEATKLISKGQFDIRVKATSNDEVGGLAEGFNRMAAEVSRLMVETSEKARMASELETAKIVQETLFPETKAQFGPYEVVGHYEPASECGGDWWSYCKINNRLYLWIGDATGHGAPAAMVTSAAKSASTIIEDLPDMSPGRALEILNKAIHETARGKILMTFFIGCIDLKTHELTYANASHEPPFLIGSKADGKKVTKGDLRPLIEVNGPRLGDRKDSKYDESKVQLRVGDSLIFYTDGVLDLQNSDGKSWGERGFIKSVCESSTGSHRADQKIQKLVLQMNGYRAQKELVDDVTFLMCQYGEAA